MTIEWFIIKCKPRQENTAFKSLKSLSSDINVFFPTIRYVKLKEENQKQWVHEALFPGYFFAKFSFDEYYKQVNYSHGVQTILRNGVDFATLPDERIQEIQEQTNKDHVLEIPEPEIRAGDSVWISEGSIAGTSGVVKEIYDGEKRALLLIEFLGQNLEIKMDLKKLFLQMT